MTEDSVFLVLNCSNEGVFSVFFAENEGTNLNPHVGCLDVVGQLLLSFYEEEKMLMAFRVTWQGPIMW